MSGARFAGERKWSALPARITTLWVPLSLNFLAIALWHGARSTFLLFGLIHGAWYIIETEIRRTKRWKSWKKRVPDDVRAVLGRALFTFVMVQTFALFRSDSISTFFYIWTHMFCAGGTVTASDIGVGLRDYALFVFAFGVIWLMPNATELLRLYRPGLITYQNQVYVWSWLRFSWRPNVLWACWGAGLVIGAMYFLTRQSPFLYMGF